MKVRNIAHRGLRRLVEQDDGRSLPPETIPKLKRILTFLFAMSSEDDLKALQFGRPHQLVGSRKGTISLSITANWRLTFRISDQEIIDLDFEDYH